MCEINELTPYERSLLKHLRREEEHYLAEYFRTDMKHPNVEQDLWRARHELKEFVVKLRKQGKRI